ncbi:MAG TPA: ribose-phosphate pyrophosphokinase [Kiloniellales bacterium]
MTGPLLHLFSLDCGRAYGEKIAGHLGTALSDHEERDFEDSEYKIRPLASVRDGDVFVAQSLHGDDELSADEKLCRLLFFIGALKDASAGRVTAVIPYLCFARKDRKTKPRDPVTTRYLAALFEAVGTDRVVTLDVHNVAAFQNAFRCRTEHLEATGLFARHFATRLQNPEVVVVSPDAGGVKRAERLRDVLGQVTGRPIGTAFMEKTRSLGVVRGETLVGDVSGKAAVIIDDLISAGTTMARTAKACRAQGATHVFAAASHGLFVGEANRLLAGPDIDELVVTDTIPPFRLSPDLREGKLVEINAAQLFAEAIHRIHTGGSIVDLLES